MGAANFETHAEGKTAADAFRAAYDQAQYDHGHAGYTGTIAEKDGFVMARGKLADMSARDYARLMLEHTPNYDGGVASSLTPEQERDWQIFDDKWGPALCIPVTDGEWIFCGYASE